MMKIEFILLISLLFTPGYGQITDEYFNRMNPIILCHEGFTPVAKEYFDRATSKMKNRNFRGTIEDFTKAIEIFRLVC